MEKVYIQLKANIDMKLKSKCIVGDVAYVAAKYHIKKKIENIELGIVEGDFYNIISPTTLAQNIIDKVDNVDLKFIDDQDVLINIHPVSKKENKFWLVLRVMVVMVLLSIGTGIAIMNFHEDVSMKDVHIRIYKILTGMDIKRPLIIQIPYSIGIGVGMALFFNKVVPDRFGGDPSPMEVEMSSYRKKVNGYIRKKLKKGD